MADKTHQWYLYTIGAVVGSTLLVAYITPYVLAPATTSFVPYRPAPALAGSIAELQNRTGVAVPTYEERVAHRLPPGRAYVIGWGGSQRSIISDTLVAGSMQGELEFFFARALAWVRANFGLQTALVQAAFIVVGAAVSVLIADRIGFRRDDDPVSRLALLGAVIGVVYFVALPFYNGYARREEIVIDQAAVDLTRDPVSAIRAQIRTADQDLDKICQKPFTRWYLSARPSIGELVALLQNRPDECAELGPPSP